MQRELDFFSEWLSANRLALNVKKTKFMLLTPHSFVHSESLSLKIVSDEIEEVDVFRFLGIQIDRNLTWDSHVSGLISKLNSLKFVFRKLSRIVPVYCLRMLYFGHIHSRLLYGLGLWGGMLKQDKWIILEKLQRSFLRLINNAHPLSETSALFLRNKILKLKDALSLEYLKLVFRIRNNLVPSCISALFTTKRHQYNTRTSGIPTIQNHNSKIFNSSFLCKAIKFSDENHHLLSSNSIKSLAKNFKYDRFNSY